MMVLFQQAIFNIFMLNFGVHTIPETNISPEKASLSRWFYDFPKVGYVRFVGGYPTWIFPPGRKAGGVFPPGILKHPNCEKVASEFLGHVRRLKKLLNLRVTSRKSRDGSLKINQFIWQVLNPHPVATLCSSFSKENGYLLLICSSLSTSQLLMILLMVQKSGVHHLGCRKPCKYWDKLPTSSGAGFLPSTVVIHLLNQLNM